MIVYSLFHDYIMYRRFHQDFDVVDVLICVGADVRPSLPTSSDRRPLENYRIHKTKTNRLLSSLNASVATMRDVPPKHRS